MWVWTCSSKGATHTICGCGRAQVKVLHTICGCGRAQVKVLHTLYVGVDVLK